MLEGRKEGRSGARVALSHLKVMTVHTQEILGTAPAIYQPQG